MVNCDDCSLPRPFSINRIENENVILYIAALENGKGTDWLYHRRTGDIVKVLGPLGNGFSLTEKSGNVLLVGGGMGIAPLVFLAEEMIKNKTSVMLLYGTPSNSRYDVESVVPEANVVITTEDGSEGYHGLITDLLPQYIDEADAVYLCGPSAMYAYILEHRNELLKDTPVQVSLESRMACGRGICYGCTIQTKHGSRRVCEHGPVFDLDDLIF